MPNQIQSRHDTWVQLQRLRKDVYEFDPSPTDWVDVFKPFRASVQPTGGPEQQQDDKTQAHITHIVRIPWKPGVGAAWRVKVLTKSVTSAYSDDDRVLNIDSVADWNDKNRYLLLRCVEETLANVVGLEEPGWIWQDLDQHTWQDNDPAIWNN